MSGLNFWVKESAKSSEDEARRLKEESKCDVMLEKDGCWVQWEEVMNFYHSQGEDRQFKVDLDTGTVIFGNGIRGKIPPPGRENISVNYEFTLGAEGM